MFLSFIIPVYNAENYLKECLDSLLYQDIPQDEYEIICVNDGSLDSSEKILRQYERYDNVRIISQKNRGVAEARNRGMAEAQGEYIWFIDSDDFIGKNILIQLSDVAKRTNADIIQFGAYTFNNELSEHEKEQYDKNALPVKSYANNSFVTRELYKKEFIDRIKVKFPSDLQYAEDQVFISKLLVSMPQIERIEKAYYFYRYHAGSAITLANTDAIRKKIISLEKAVPYFDELYRISPAEHKAAIADNLMASLYMLIYVICGLPKSQYKISKKTLREKGILLYKRPKECTLKKSYMLDTGNTIGKLFDRIYLHLNTNWGRAIMRGVRVSRRLLSIIKK